MKTRKAKKPNEAKKAAKEAANEEIIDVGDAKSANEFAVDLNTTGRGKLLRFLLRQRQMSFLELFEAILDKS